MEKTFVFFAKLYNDLPKQLQIALMVATSMLAAFIVNIVIVALTHANVTNPAIQEFIATVLPFLTIVFNLLQQYAKDEGTKLLAAQGDTKTVTILQNAIADKQAIIASK